MNAECPRCKALHEITRKNMKGPVACACGEEFYFEPPKRRRAPSRRKLIQCPHCSRIYDPREITEGKKICLSCGHLIVLKESAPLPPEQRKSDRQVTYGRTETQTLLKMCTLMSSSFDRDSVLSEIMKITNDMLHAEGSSIILLDEEKGEMTFHIATGMKSEELKRMKLKIGEGIAGHVFRNKAPLIVNNVRKDRHFSPQIDNATRFHTRNLLCVPVFVGDRIIGVLEAVNKKERSLFDDYDVKIAAAIASQAGLAIEKSSLIEENIMSERLIAIGQTVSNLSFCIKNILTTLDGWTSNMESALKDHHIENQMKSWTMIRTGISRISELVGDMILFSGKKPQESDAVQINEIIDDIVKLLKETAEAGNVRLTALCDPSMPLSMAHRKNIYRSIMNLVLNAIEACAAEGGTVELHSTANHHDQVMFIEIVDNGAGIAADNLDRIFSVFFTTKGHEHSGLGLTVAKKIIEEHGGGIAVESLPGKGSRFLLKLPVIACEKET